jgi:tRNA A22 N-methylase
MRHAIDYSFFQAWTERIEQLEQAGQQDEASRLTARRQQILQIVEEIDKEAQALLEGGVEVLREIMAASDTEAALRSAVDKLDEAFMFVLATNIAAAQRAGQSETVARLQEIERLATEIVQESLSPEDRFINELMLAETPQESTKLLRQRAAQVTPDFVKRLNELAEEQEQRGAKEVAETLRRLAREAGAMLF